MGTMNIDEIIKMLPHRYPILLVDRVLESDGKKRIVGLKNVTANEPYFQGHFPGNPIMPGVLQLEAMAQTGGLLLYEINGSSEGVPYFIGIDKARFRRVVKPGDQMKIVVEIISLKLAFAKFHGQVLVDGEIACEAELMCMLQGAKGKSA